jgi:hypothetical protein
LGQVIPAFVPSPPRSCDVRTEAISFFVTVFKPSHSVKYVKKAITLHTLSQKSPQCAWSYTLTTALATKDRGINRAAERIEKRLRVRSYQCFQRSSQHQRFHTIFPSYKPSKYVALMSNSLMRKRTKGKHVGQRCYTSDLRSEKSGLGNGRL